MHNGSVTANYQTHIQHCIGSPMSTNLQISGLSCMSTVGMPIMPYMILGGFQNPEGLVTDQSEVTRLYLKTARSLVITVIGRNMPKGHPDLDLAMAYESGLVKWLGNYSRALSSKCSVTYRTERSIEDEIERESHSDVLTIAISYTIMFVYIAVALSISNYEGFDENESSTFLSTLLYRLRSYIVGLKLTLALTGVLCAMWSVFASVGFFSYLRFPTTLIIFEVVPFLVLAVGVDNIFLLTRAVQRVKNADPSQSKSVRNQLGVSVGQIGPSILLTGSAECIAFLMGTMTSVPAVRMFSLYASMALFIDLLLQLTAFISIISLDSKRQAGNRADLFCCFRLGTKGQSPITKSNVQQTGSPGRESGDQTGRYLIKSYSRLLLKGKVRPLVILACSTWCFSSIMIIGKLSIGLDPKLTVPQDSYVLDFMDQMQEHLRVGPPVYFMLISKRGRLNFESKAFRLAICGRSGCDTDSLVNQISWAARRSNLSRIAYSPSSWIDDYEQWLHPQSSCCFVDSNNTFCNATLARDGHNCSTCPSHIRFDRYLPFFLADVPGEHCPLGGRAAYKDALVFNKFNQISASYFMTYHTLLVTSQDFIAALKSAEWLASNITLSLHSKGFDDVFVIPYSVFYVFYEQYLNIWQTILINVSLSVFAIFTVSFVLLGFDLTSAMVIVVTIAMITVNLGGLMYLWSIELNAVSLVNVVMSLGISVEFCAHIVREFTLITYGTRRQRARIALINVGEAVFTGITLTKIGGIVVLAFSHSQLFQVFYFRMYLCIIFCGVVHGLVFLPVLLSYAGPSIRWTFTDDHVPVKDEIKDINTENSIKNALLADEAENEASDSVTTL